MITTLKKHDVIEASIMFPEQDFILEINPKENPKEIFKWCRNNIEVIEQALIKYGGIAFRGFNLTPDEFAEITQIITPEKSLNYTGGIAPRKHVGNGVYISSTVEKGCEIPQHHEMAYFRKWPMKLFFYCETPATTGGETTLVSTRTFMKRISPSILKKIEEKEVLYVRNYIDGINSNWRQSFETNDRKAVEEACYDLGLDFEWRQNDQLRTRNLAQGVAFHPITKEKIWHNHAHVFNLYCGKPGELTPTMKMTKTAFTPEYFEAIQKLHHEDLPTNTYYGDGTLFESNVIEEICAIFAEEKLAFEWVKGDFMFIDNMLAFHGRNPYTGDQRKTLAVLK